MMKSPRKRRGARAAAHSTRRDAAPDRRQQIRHETRKDAGSFSGRRSLAPPGEPRRAAGSQVAPCEQRRTMMRQATLTEWTFRDATPSERCRLKLTRTFNA
ncbi:hypothetical protein PAL_GLEAN10021884 [Pteropus alecto]|uniref:Uncharacterized protein n=1 Tax=Pteropus alecto TaxID=9402 RepID=L5KNY5_PTEAL|nr:hypothetical protein PAL_GLEAN10021884 [Pteropus alecto]